MSPKGRDGQDEGARLAVFGEWGVLDRIRPCGAAKTWKLFSRRTMWTDAANPPASGVAAARGDVVVASGRGGLLPSPTRSRRAPAALSGTLMLSVTALVLCVPR
jgi:hypothetical protein